MSTAASPSPLERALFATTARLISCLVTESLTRAYYLPLHLPNAPIGVAVLLAGNVFPDNTAFDAGDVIAVVALRHPPVFRGEVKSSRGREIGLLDPQDLHHLVFLTSKTIIEGTSEHEELCSSIAKSLGSAGWTITECFQLYLCTDPISLWNTFATGINLDQELSVDIASELSSAVKWQTYSYQHPPRAPLFRSSSIDWEQSIVEGHPTHPMHKTRRFLPPLPDFLPGSYDLYHPKLRLISVPRENLKITYNFEALSQPILDAVMKSSGQHFSAPDGHVVVPVHELQLLHIEAKFPDAIIYPAQFSLPLLAQQSLRSVLVPDAYRDLHLKLGVGIKLTSAVRTISPESAYLGPRFSAKVVPVLALDPNVVTVAKELASVVHGHADGEIAKHCSAIIRESPESTSEERQERLIVCTALVESGHAGVDGHLPSVIRVFGLDNDDKRAFWFKKFVQVFFQAFLPPMLQNGVAFECHPQNCVARFDVHTKELKGFIIRDFGGLRVHRETLLATTGVELDFLDGHSIIAADLDDVYTRMYHTVFHNHLQQLIRVLGLHYNGRGWKIVRDQLGRSIPPDHPLYKAWLCPDRTSLPGKCFLRMRMAGMYRFHLHAPFPNLIHYQGADE
ncbi:hypothetical protein K443DRAFT_141341 [Laccaria amethystina LaAM-08-1]|uniref:IucC family-domain-containing protein n=1 Tax=Laccaria amethystina LaAM-08-1 TaxID=1095629 RepID=A0A0C9YIM0_9AGAR|nr:hypothetical protein K443DRAFT_141341 [Laccaria amethystina LaAM-08-1]